MSTVSAFTQDTQHTTAIDIDIDESKLVRRANLMHIDPFGVLQSLAETQEQSTVLTQCDREFVLMAEGTDTCTDSSTAIMSQTDCELAVHPEQEGSTKNRLGLLITDVTKAEAANFVLSTREVNPLPYVKGCFLDPTTQKIALNPTVPAPEDGKYQGRKICMREKYTNSEINTDGATGCTHPILDEAECKKAAMCKMGSGACSFDEYVTIPPFLQRILVTDANSNSTYKANDKPKGCFQDKDGCWGFNHFDGTPGAISDGSTAVCLSTASTAGR